MTMQFPLTVEQPGIYYLPGLPFPVTASPFPAGGVVNVTATAPVLSSGGGTPNISLAASPAAGVYTNPSALTVDAVGRVTAAASGAAPVTAVSGTAPIASSGGATPAISIAAATPGAAGSMSGADKTKLNAMVQTVFVLNPAGPAGGNVYTNWASLYAVLAGVTGYAIVYVVGGAAVPVPAGVYTVDAVSFFFEGLSGLSFASGAQLKFRWLELHGGISLFVTAGGSSLLANDIQATLVIDDGAIVQDSGAASANSIADAGANTLNMFVRGGTQLTASHGHVVDDHSGQANLYVTEAAIVNGTVAETTASGIGVLFVDHTAGFPGGLVGSATWAWGNFGANSMVTAANTGAIRGLSTIAVNIFGGSNAVNCFASPFGLDGVLIWVNGTLDTASVAMNVTLSLTANGATLETKTLPLAAGGAKVDFTFVQFFAPSTTGPAVVVTVDVNAVTSVGTCSSTSTLLLLRTRLNTTN